MDRKPTDTTKLILDARNIDVADAVGDYLGGESLLGGMAESRSASKALLQRPLHHMEYSPPQNWKRQVLRSLEYFVRKFDTWQDILAFGDDLRVNHRTYNNLSLSKKVAYKRAFINMEYTHKHEGGKGKIVESMFHLRNKAVILRPKDVFAPGGHIEPEDHTVDSIAMAHAAMREPQEEGGFRKPGITRKPHPQREEFKFRDVNTKKDDK